METFNIHNVMNQLNKLIRDNYNLKKSAINQCEIDLANNLFDVINNFVDNINENIEDGELEDGEETINELSEKGGNESEYEVSPQKVRLS